MTAHRDPDRLISAFLAEGVDELPDRAYEHVRSSIERTRQRAAIGPWREQDMSAFGRIAIAAAAVLVAAVIGVNLFSPPGQVGPPGPTPSPSPSPTLSPSPSVEAIPQEGADEPGHYVGLFPAEPDGPNHEFTFDLPAGWSTDSAGGIITHTQNGADPPNGAGLILFDLDDVRIYRDSCQWQDGDFVDLGQGVEGMADAFAMLPRLVSGPADVTVDGYAGKMVELTTPDNLSFGACTNAEYRTFVTGIDDARYHQGPSQHDRMYVLDVGGEIFLVDASYYPRTPAGTMAELESILQSIHFER